MTRIPLNHFAGQAQDLRERLEMSTAEIGLSVRTTNFGEKTLEEVYIALEQIGFYRKTKREAALV
jgi:DNA-directed RNA polymerase subunit alpha